ncbi:MAG: hypothetical protein LLG97_19365 [Deltaproteobacteria bacterium]|nr:hypothetical protein [Deltaproteobacteria bacterium]
MPLLVAKTQIAAKAESAEGSAEVLAGADVFLAENVKFTPSILSNKRKPTAASLSGFAAVPGLRSGQMEFDVELKGSGTAGTPPALGKLLKTCGFGEATVAVTSVTYTPASSAISSMTLAAYMDGMIKKIWGARGTVSIKLESGKPAYLHFVYTGADFSVTDGAMLSAGVSFETTKPIAFQGGALTVDSYAAVISLLEINIGNKVSLRPDAAATSGHKSAVIAARDPVMTFDPETVLVATYDFYGKLRSGAEGALSAVLTGSAGNICTITAPKVQYVDVKPAEREGFRTLGIDCQLNRNTGDDELSIAFT